MLRLVISTLLLAASMEVLLLSDATAPPLNPALLAPGHALPMTPPAAPQCWHVNSRSGGPFSAHASEQNSLA
jgi:hypothetical protein